MNPPPTPTDAMSVPRPEDQFLPAVSIVIPSRFRHDLLEKCLETVVAFATVPMEIIVIDDGSPEGNVSRVAERFPVTRIIRNEVSVGFAAAVQSGIDLAKAPVIHLLNDDTRVTAGWLDLPLACLRDRRVGAVTPLVLRDNGSVPPRIDSAGDSYAASGRVFKRLSGRRVPLAIEGRWVFGASGSSAFYRKEALAEVGGFPVEFGAYFEDVEVSWRLQRGGWRVWFCPESVVWHKVTASYGTVSSDELMEKMVGNQEMVFVNHGLSLYKGIGLVLHLLLMLFRLLKVFALGKSVVFLRGVIKGLNSSLLMRPKRFSWRMRPGMRIPTDLI
ncbi:MAG: glycosyltransferase family 2 protein [Planctomycetota bacterium]